MKTHMQLKLTNLIKKIVSVTIYIKFNYLEYINNKTIITMINNILSILLRLTYLKE